MDYDTKLMGEIQKRISARNAITKHQDGKPLETIFLSDLHCDTWDQDDLCQLTFLKIWEQWDGNLGEFFIQPNTGRASRHRLYDAIIHDVITNDARSKATQEYRWCERGGDVEDWESDKRVHRIFQDWVEEYYWSSRGDQNEAIGWARDPLQDLIDAPKPEEQPTGTVFTDIDKQTKEMVGDLSNLLKNYAWRRLKSGQTMLATDLIDRIRSNTNSGTVRVDRIALARFLDMNEHSIDYWRKKGKITGKRMDGRHGKEVWGYDLLSVAETLVGRHEAPCA